MYNIKMYCNDNGKQYWEDNSSEYESKDKALLSCLRNAIEESQELMFTSDINHWFEVNLDFEVTETYATDELALGTIFPIAVVCYDKAPWDRENDCDIKILTGYYIVDTEEGTPLKKYNDMLREKYGENITVQIKSYTEDDDSEWYYYTSSMYGDSDAFETIEEAYDEACTYLDGVGDF